MDIDRNSALHDNCFLVLQVRLQAALTWPAMASNLADMLVQTIVLLGASASNQACQATPTLDSLATKSNLSFFIDRFTHAFPLLSRSLAFFLHTSEVFLALFLSSISKFRCL